MSLKKNVIANYLGQGWRVLMSVAFVPVYIKFLGIEAYGLIGIFAMLQAWLSLLDMALKPALSREMARYTGGAHNSQSIWNLLRSIEFIVISITVIVGLSIWFASDWLASNWVNSENIPHNVVSQAFTLMGLVTALRFIENLYSSCIIGLERQVLQNIIISVVATFHGVGSVVILLWISPTIEAFFLWQAFIAFLTVIFFRFIVYRILPSPPSKARCSLTALLSVWRFAGGMLGIALLSLLLMQVDKILLSRLVTLEAFGYYALAGLVASVLFMFVAPIASAFYPRFVQLYTKQDTVALSKAYHQSTQLVSVLMGSAAMILIAFSERILLLWSSDPVLTYHVAPIVIILTLGNLLNGLMWIPYQMQLAHGWTSLTTKINIFAVTLLIPAIIITVPIYGSVGAAWIWVILNTGYVLIGINFMYQRILKNERWKWYRNDILIPLTIAGITALLCKWALPKHLGIIGEILVILGSSILVLFMSSITCAEIRRQIMHNLPITTQKILDNK